MTTLIKLSISADLIMKDFASNILLTDIDEDLSTHHANSLYLDSCQLCIVVKDTHTMIIYIRDPVGRKPHFVACKQQRRGPASASVKSGGRLSCLPCE